MYIPKKFKSENKEHIKELIDQYPLATLICLDQRQITHLPLMLEQREENWYLLGHFARANPYVSLLEDKRHLCVFNGPDFYVSPKWYESDNQVPTWNYIVAHLEVESKITQSKSLLEKQVRHFEKKTETDWSIENLPVKEQETLFRAIIVFEMKVLNVSAKFKMGQNKDSKDQQSLLNHVTENHPEAAQWLKRLVAVATTGGNS